LWASHSFKSIVRLIIETHDGTAQYRVHGQSQLPAHLPPALKRAPPSATPGLAGTDAFYLCFSLYETPVSANLKVDCYSVQQFVIIRANVHFDVRWICVFEQRRARYASPQRLLVPVVEV
jgi:hypothetical protein